MRRHDSDLRTRPESELQKLDQDELLRLVVICRDGDEKSRKRARAAWELLVALDIERVRAIVKTFRFPGQAGVQVHHDNVEDVVISAYQRLVRMFGTFRGTAPGQYRAALRTCVFRECQDHCRNEMEEDKRRAGSLDQQLEGEDGGGRGRFEKDVAKKELRETDEQDALERDEELVRILAQRLRDGLSQLDGNRRRVLELTRAGRSTQEIQDELGISRDNVYQLRRRALEDLRRLLDEDGEH